MNTSLISPQSKEMHKNILNSKDNFPCSMPLLNLLNLSIAGFNAQLHLEVGCQ